MTNAAAEATAAEVVVVEAAVGEAAEAAEAAEPNSSRTHRAPKDGLNSPTGTAQSTEQERNATWEDIAGPTDSIQWDSSTTAKHAWRSAGMQGIRRMPQRASD